MPTPTVTREHVVPTLLTTEEVAALLRCSPRTLELDRIRHRWKVPVLKMGKLVRYDRAAVLKWLADQNPTDQAG